MRWIIGLLLVLLIMLQYKAWFGDTGRLAADELRSRVASQRDRADVLAQRNRLLTAEVLAFKEGHAAVENRARSDLGMIKAGETFFLVNDGRVYDHMGLLVERGRGGAPDAAGRTDSDSE